MKAMKRNQFKRGMTVMLSVPWKEGLHPATFLKIVHGKAIFQLDLELGEMAKPPNRRKVEIVECLLADMDLLGFMKEATDNDLQ
jgi:hypothetical protein